MRSLLNWMAGTAVSLIAWCGTEKTKKRIRYGRVYGMGHRKLLRSALGMKL